MAVPNNILQQVQTYQLSNLAYLQNLNCFVATANTKFKNFEKLTANLGDTVTFDLPPRFTTWIKRSTFLMRSLRNNLSST
jgi:hypothetical protein